MLNVAPVTESIMQKKELNRCAMEQLECGDYLRAGGPDSEGAKRGAADWIGEETLIRSEYGTFLDNKAQLGGRFGFKPLWMPSFLFDFQAALAEFNIETGRSGSFADCGMGKTLVELVWGENVIRHTNGRVLLMSPVAAQILREAEKFGVELYRSRDGKSGAPTPGHTRALGGDSLNKTEKPLDEREGIAPQRSECDPKQWSR